jgi:UDP-glucose 4-epimerase
MTNLKETINWKREAPTPGLTALVTGGAGFIGSNLVKRLVEKGFAVDVVDDFSNGHKEFLEDVRDRIKIYKMDFADKIILSNIRSGKYDIIFHEAAIPRVSFSCEEPSFTTDVNIGKTVKLMEAAVRQIPHEDCETSMPRFVFASSSSVYGGADIMPTPELEAKKPVSPYALQKSVIEDFCKLFYHLYGLESACLRYFNVFGPNQYGDSPYSTAVSAWCDAVKHGKSLRSDGDGEQTRDLCYVDNVVDANLIVALSEETFKGDCFNVACGDRTSNNEILEYFKKKFHGIEIVHAPERAGDVKHTQADISKIMKLGYSPSIKFWDGLEKTIEWWNLKG